MSGGAKRFGTSAETALRAFLQERGYLVIRSAASKVLDIVCVRPNLVCGIEVKATHGNVFYVSKSADARAQREELLRMQDAYPGLKVLYVVRFGCGTFEAFDPYCFTVMQRGTGTPIETAFPRLHIAPNKPPIVPHGSDARVVLNEGDKDTRGSWYIAPDGDTRDASC